MEGQMPNPGQFMAPAGGGGSAVLQAMARRGMLPATAQVGNTSPISPGAPRIPQVPAGSPSGLPAFPGVPQEQPQPAPSLGQEPSAGALPMGNPEAELIIKALAQRLRDLSGMEKQQVAPAPAPAPAPQMPGGMI